MNFRNFNRRFHCGSFFLLSGRWKPCVPPWKHLRHMFSNSQAFAFFGQQIAFKFSIQVLLSSFFSGINNFFLHKQNVNFKNKFKGWLISSWAISNLPRSYSLRVPLQWSIFREWRNLHTQRQYSLNLNQTTTHCNCLNNSQYSNLCRCSLKKKSIPSKVKLSTQFRPGE